MFSNFLRNIAITNESNKQNVTTKQYPIGNWVLLHYKLYTVVINTAILYYKQV